MDSKKIVLCYLKIKKENAVYTSMYELRDQKTINSISGDRLQTK
jgi:hypothetical protein